MKRVIKFVFYTLLAWVAIFTFWSKTDPANSVNKYSSIRSSSPQQLQPTQASQSLPLFPPIDGSSSSREFLYNTWNNWGNSIEAGNRVNAGIYILQFDAQPYSGTKELSIIK